MVADSALPIQQGVIDAEHVVRWDTVLECGTAIRIDNLKKYFGEQLPPDKHCTGEHEDAYDVSSIPTNVTSAFVVERHLRRIVIFKML